jgi:hypothetical protein
MSSAPTAARAATLAALALILSSSSCCACADQTRKYTIQNLKKLDPADFAVLFRQL